MKLVPDTPTPLQLPPAGNPVNAISVSLKHIRFCRAAAVTTGAGFTVNTAAFHVTV